MHCISVLSILPGFIVVAVGISLSMPAVILGGIIVLAVGTVATVFRSMSS